MSYVVGVWEQPANLPLPGEIRSATRLMDMLYRVSPGSNPKFRELAARLLARYPDFDSLEAGEESDEAECVWVDGSLSGNTEAAVWNLGIVSDWLDEVLPFVIEAATGLGLNVFDGQAAQVNFADGTVITQYGWRLMAEEMALFDGLAPWMAAQGWEAQREERAFSLSLENSWHRLDLEMHECWPPHFRFSFTLRSDQESVGRERCRIEGTEWERDSGPLTIAYQGGWLRGDEAHPFLGDRRTFVLGSMKDLADVLSFVRARFESDLLPLVESYDRIDGFDALVNPPVLRESMFFHAGSMHDFERGYRNVLAANLAGNPRAAAICDEVQAALEGMVPSSGAYFATEKAVAHVRQCLAGA